MNALWLTRIAAYKNTPRALESAKQLILLKIERESVLLRRYHRRAASPFDTGTLESTQGLLLAEARAARHFWGEFRALIPAAWGFMTRMPHAEDAVNRLLDIGYHHLTGIVRKFLEQRSVPPDLALIHVARASDSAPLAYDLVELFRADTVDAEVLRFVRLKKKPRTALAQKDIPVFLGRLNTRLGRMHYLKELNACRTYRYYLELQILKFISAVNHATVFEPFALPARHETRCRLTAKEAMLSSH